MPLDDPRARPLLEGYSEGRISLRQAMDALGMPPDRYSEFVDGMNDLKLPWPRPSKEQIEAEAEIVAQAIQESLR